MTGRIKADVHPAFLGQEPVDNNSTTGNGARMSDFISHFNYSLAHTWQGFSLPKLHVDEISLKNETVSLMSDKSRFRAAWEELTQQSEFHLHYKLFPAVPMNCANLEKETQGSNKKGCSIR